MIQIDLLAFKAVSLHQVGFDEQKERISIKLSHL